MENRAQFAKKNIELKTVKTEPWEVIVSSLLIIVAIISSIQWAYLAAALILFALWIFVKHNMGSGTILTRFLPAQLKKSNIYISKNINESKKNILLLVPEKYSQQKISKQFKKIYQIYLYGYLFLSIVAVFWLYSKEMMDSQILFYSGNSILILNQAIFLIFYLHTQKTSNEMVKEVNLSIDSLSEIQNLHVLVKPENDSLSFVTDYLNNQEEGLNPQNCYVLNISKYLNETFTVISGEGVIIFHEYENPILNKSKTMDMPSQLNKFYNSDILPFLNQGYQGISVEFSENNDDNQEKILALLKN